MDNFNETHPELLPGEAWLTNYWPKDSHSREPHFVPRGRTVRFGSQAYTTNGTALRDGKPVFISKEELAERKSHYEAQ